MAEKKTTILITEEEYKKGLIFFQTITDLELITVPKAESSIAKIARKKKPFAIILGTEKYTSELYNTLERGSIIARFGIGCDGIDLKKTSECGIIVTNTPGILESTVAEFTLFLAGEIMRKIGYANQEMKNKHWTPVLGKELRGKTWAILGFGKIGKQLSRILSFGFGVKVFAFDILNNNPRRFQIDFGIEKISSELKHIIPYADIVSLHLPSNENTRHFINKESLKLFKNDSILINTARGSLIDESALYDAIKKKYLVGAGLDVFENEPYSPIESEKDLRNLPSVILTPHIASSTIECSIRIAEKTIQNIRYAVKGKYELMDIVKRINYE